MKRRDLLKWTAPVITVVALPAHAITTAATATLPGTSIPTPDTAQPRPEEPHSSNQNPCDEGQVPVCYDVPAEVETKRTLCVSPVEAEYLVTEPMVTEGTCKGATANR